MSFASETPGNLRSLTYLGIKELKVLGLSYANEETLLFAIYP